MCKRDVKSPTAYEEQIKILEERGLIVSNRNNALEVLKRINYYRFTAYTLSLKRNDEFYDNVTFEKIYSLYEFDKRLRTLIMDMLENIEIAMRAHISYVHSHKYGALGYGSHENFDIEAHHKSFIKDLDREKNRSKELFLLHNRTTYKDIAFWVAIEILTFGTLSKLFKNLKTEDKKIITCTYYSSIPYTYIESWLRSLTEIRNACAHYSRLYNKNFINHPRLSKSDRELVPDSRKIFANIYVMKKLCPDKKIWRSFLLNLQALVLQYEDAIKLDLIGFPINWEHMLMD
jgi:abortive infection bacteriophage resistance protein